MDLAVSAVPVVIDGGIGHSPPASVVGSRPLCCRMYAARSALVWMEVMESILGVVSWFNDMMWVGLVIV
jgi:hypothetical protein